MKILIRQFLGKNHSWAHFGWGIATAAKNLNHEVHLWSTDGIEHLPHSLKENLIGYVEENVPTKLYGRTPDKEYDCQISYTCMKNFPALLSSGQKNRLGIWCYEWAGKNILPTGFAKHYQSCDYLCAPSNFAKRVFLESNIPESKIRVIPHGINAKEYEENTKITLPTKKKFKILANIAQNHIRKNIAGLLNAYGKAFCNQDDVCLIIKGKEKPVKSLFEVSLNKLIGEFKTKYPKHAEIQVFSDYVNDISSLYRSVDAVFTMSHCEGFFFPRLESIACGKLVIAPNFGGQIDFLNETNALLIDGKETRADPKSMYWENKNNAIWFSPNVDDAVEKLRYAYRHFESMNELVEKGRQLVINAYNWETITGRFMELCK